PAPTAIYTPSLHDALPISVKDLKSKQIDALVTAPLNKNNINHADFKLIGHTEYLTADFGNSKSLMFLVTEDMRVGKVTAHMPLKEVAENITTAKIKEKLEIMLRSLQDDFGINKPRVAVLGLNPHAGEDSLLGREEDEIIRPLIKEFRDRGASVFGPYPSDGFFGM